MTVIQSTPKNWPGKRNVTGERIDVERENKIWNEAIDACLAAYHASLPTQEELVGVIMDWAQGELQRSDADELAKDIRNLLFQN